ncbi:hypothetical protein C5C66_07865 [Rathayibacter toxicus]|uniref:Orn/DAP/Arg decarboxylase 2 N-terminal domain-containing protein n=1 Tax=Rathayibacter toxicus TaxID=145458 RepID=A0A0C5BTB3_9MICO|nr:hypothetical protein [Rathayibacter toxicus]AJM77912.1 hypothetical protein TI83_08025 [Rathayibacter toxicus]ALS57892.1 hypothetical protein APU90_09060 [Rathayibacter toxicus]KKM46912.1 hypothetical protein VT73_01155 [Rathayibacter toxicus]PPG20430.1 hypothetical protein C5D15_07865 [Rathayibacter toxicus]PPG45532.1 hypothetical protein C5D16_07835 [Rathayibacter toxicus]
MDDADARVAAPHHPLAPEWLHTPEEADSLVEGVWSRSTRRATDGSVTVAGVSACELAVRCGTPLFVLDEVTVYYAGKAFLSTDVARWMRDDGLNIDLASGGQLAFVLVAGIDPARRGLHGPISSQIFGAAGFVESTYRLLDLHAQLLADGPVPELNIGGGFGIAYTSAHDPTRVEEIAVAIADAVAEQCASRSIPVPHFAIEPVPVRVVGKYCECGDSVVHDDFLPTDAQSGDLLAVAATGAYCWFLASNDNYLARPPVVTVCDGQARVIVHGESEEDLLRRDTGIDRKASTR